MIPILYPWDIFAGTTTPPSNLGLRPLVDAISCIVTKNIDGEFELTLELPITDKPMPYLDSIIMVNCGMKNPQFFEVYRIEEGIEGGTAVITAWHVSYRNNYDIAHAITFSTSSYTIAQGFNMIWSNSYYQSMVTYDVTGLDSRPGIGDFQCDTSTFREAANAYADYCECIWKYDNFVGRMTNNVADNGVQFTTQKNIYALTKEADISELVTGFLPYYDTGQRVAYYRVYTMNGSPYSYHRIVPYNLAESGWTGDAAPSQSIVDDAMRHPLSKLSADILENITLDAFDLGIQVVDLYELATIRCPEIGITVKKPVVAIEYDVLEGVLLSAQFGQLRHDITKTIALGSSNNRLIGTGRKI